MTFASLSRASETDFSISAAGWFVSKLSSRALFTMPMRISTGTFLTPIVGKSLRQAVRGPVARSLSAHRVTVSAVAGFAGTVEQLAGVDLDEAQRAVLALPQGESAVVVGPPGSGKTTTMVELVAARVDAGWRPSDLLVLSPARQAASQLRDRIALRLGVPTGGPVARTAASVAFEIVREDAARRGDSAPRLL